MIGAEAARAPASTQRGALAFPGVQALLEGLGEMALLSRDALRQLLARPPEWRLVVDQLEQIGWRSLSIVNLTALFTGMVLALQLGNEFRVQPVSDFFAEAKALLGEAAVA